MTAPQTKHDKRATQPTNGAFQVGNNVKFTLDDWPVGLLYQLQHLFEKHPNLMKLFNKFNAANVIDPRDFMIDQLARRELVPRDAYKHIVFRGMPIGSYADNGLKYQSYDLATAITDVHMSMTTQQITQMTITLEDPHLHFYRSNMFIPGSLVTYRDVPFIISTSTVSDGSSGLGGVTVACRSMAIQVLKDRQTQKGDPLYSVHGTVADYVAKECSDANVAAYVQPVPQDMLGNLKGTFTRDVVNPDQFYAAEEIPSAWTTMQKYAQQIGYVLFECYGVIFFGLPSWFYEQALRSPDLATNVGLYWESEKSQLTKQTRSQNDEYGHIISQITEGTTFIEDGIQWIGCRTVPSLTVSFDQAPGPMWTVTCNVPNEFSNVFALGQRMVIRGMDSYDEGTELWVSGIEYSLAGTGDCVVTGTTPYDPKPFYKLKTPKGAGSTVGVHLNPRKVYGGYQFSQKGLDHAVEIYNACQYAGVTDKDTIVAICTAMTETGGTLLNYSNPDLPESSQVPNDGLPPHDPVTKQPYGDPYVMHSCGLFQQRDPWGDVIYRMDPTVATLLFLNDGSLYYKGQLITGPDHAQLPPGLQTISKHKRAVDSIPYLCQKVQVSGFPDAYAKFVDAAKAVFRAIRASSSAVANSGNLDGWAPGHPITTRRASDFVNIALTQKGKPYYSSSLSFVPKTLRYVLSNYDCSLLVEWAAYQVGVVGYGRSTREQYPNCQRNGTIIPVQEALHTRGAVLFRDPLGGSAHTAISLGDGNRTLESYDIGVGVVIGGQHGQQYGDSPWDFGAKIPHMIYP